METSAGLKTSKTRDTNIELLRIIAMMMIVAHHYIWHGEALKQTALYSSNWFFSWTIEAICVVAVNCYVLISSYYLVNSQFKINRLIKIWLQILFYSTVIYLILVATGFEHLSIKNLVTSCLPILTNRYWFATVYIALYIFSPFLNTLIHALNHNQMRNLVIILFAMLSIWPTILPFGFSLDITNGYSIIQFGFLYFLGAYIRLYWNFNLKWTFYFNFYVVISILIICSKILFEFLGFNGLSYTFFLYNSASVILSSVMLFMFFKSISINNYIINKIINSIAVLTFGVYL
ncbi:MAG: acyltransferase family protein, partial [Clostridiales bacterium]